MKKLQILAIMMLVAIVAQPLFAVTNIPTKYITITNNTVDPMVLITTRNNNNTTYDLYAPQQSNSVPLTNVTVMYAVKGVGISSPGNFSSLSFTEDATKNLQVTTTSR
jgi:hypothetical protein